MPSSATQWRPGQSGNPSGRPKIAALVREMAQADTPEAYETVKAMMLGADKDSTKLAAALAILKMAGVFSTSTDGTRPSPSLSPPPQPTPTARLVELVKPPSPNSGGEAS